MTTLALCDRLDGRDWLVAFLSLGLLRGGDSA
jgi:hypothetical protein